MKNLFQRFLCEWLILTAVLLFIFTRNLSSPYDKSIVAEGFGYYAYLPGVFIYNDIDSFKWFDEVYPKYYPPGFNPPSRNFLAPVKNDFVNKYFPGMALLVLPFFLIAHFLALAGAGEADGFSLIYQIAFAASAFFYAWLGLKFLKKLLLLFNFNERVIFKTVFALFLGTHLLFYTIYGSFQPHTYLFFLITALGFNLKIFFSGQSNNKTLFYISFLSGLIVLLRPFDAVFIFCIPVFGFRFAEIGEYKRKIFRLKQLLAITIPFVALIFLLFGIWYNQTGSFILDPYGGERFYFNKPHWLDLLFSFRRGWFLYTPLAALSFAGLIFFQNKKHVLLICSFFLALTYILSCWWSWTFGTNFGLRPLVDFNVLIAIMIAFLFAGTQTALKQIILTSIVFVFCLLNIWQSFQFQKGIIHPDYTSSETYFRYFFTYKQPASFPIPPKTILQRQEFQYNFESEDNAFDANTKSNKIASEGKYSAILHANNPYVLGEKFGFPAFFQMNEFDKIRVKANIKGKSSSGKSVLAIDFRKAITGENLHWYSLPLEKYKNANDWTYIEAGCIVPENISKNDSLSIYFWNTEGNDTTWIDRVEIEFIKTDSLYELSL